MKKTVLTLVLSLLSIVLFSQETERRYDNANRAYGLYNKRTNRWVSARVFQDIYKLGYFNGIYYYRVERNNLWGVMDDRGALVVGVHFEQIGSFANGFFAVKRDGSWGLADTDNHLLIACRYKSIGIYTDTVHAYPWKGDQYDIWHMEELFDIRDNANKADKERVERENLAKLERNAKEKKEKELASFTEYARAFVEPRINQWQQKGEFEKIADYQKRVTNPNRTAMIDSLTQVAEKNFIADHASLKPENEYMKLDLYDSENEVFLIESTKLGSIVVHVPISDAPNFKSHFHSLEKKNAIYYIDNDKIALASLDFYDKATDKTYHYSNENAMGCKFK